MSEKDVEVVQALLQELIEIVSEKPAIAKRLMEAISYRLVEVAVDPLVIYQREGGDALRRKLKKMTTEHLRILVKQQHIPCQNLGKRKKTDLIDVIARYAANTDIGGGRKIGEAA